MESQKRIGLVLLLFLSGLLLCLAESKAAAKYYEFVLKEENFTRLCSTKTMLTVNGMFPGPEIRVNEGETIHVNVINKGRYNVTIHWHGVKQPNNPWHDGPEYVTQCPIQPSNNFTYKVIFSDEIQSLWWHAHSDWARVSLHGIIVINPTRRNDLPFPKPYKDQAIILGSWFKGDVNAMVEEALATGAETNSSDALSINGQPGDFYECSNASTFRLKVEYGKTYLLRLVNAGMNEELFFNVANHTLTVVAADGAYIKPINTHFVMITPGQTMDILFNATRTPGHYYMAASPFAAGEPEFDNTTATAILEYDGGDYGAPTKPFFQTSPLYNDTGAAYSFTSRLRSLNDVNLPKTADEHMLIAIAVNLLPCPNATCAGPDGRKLSASMNNISFAAPTIDILEAYYGNLSGVYKPNFPNYPPRAYNYTGSTDESILATTVDTRVKVLEYGKSVEIVLQGTTSAPMNHPIHLHGQSFRFVGAGYGNYNNETAPATFNLVDPPLINTVGVPGKGWAVIRFTAENPGVWFMHCHLERHSSWGMAAVFIVKNGKTKDARMLPAPAYMPPC